MIKPQVYQPSQHTNQTLSFLQRPFVHGIGNNSTTSLPLWSTGKQVQRQKDKRFVLVPRNVQANPTSATAIDTTDKTTEKSAVKLKAVVKVKITASGFFSSLRLDRGIDDITDLLGKSLLLELVSSDLDPSKYIYIFFYLCFFNFCLYIIDYWYMILLNHKS